MGTVRVENRGHSFGEAVIVLVIVAVLLGALLWPAALIATRPSAGEARRAELAADQQARLDASWRPWTTAAENLAVICGCLGVPTGIALVSFVVVRRTRVMWPLDDTRLHVRTPPSRPGGNGSSAVLMGVPTRPEPQSVDAA